MHRVSKAFCAMGYCIIPNVGCEGSLYIKNTELPTCFVPHCMRRSQMNLIARNAVSYLKKRIASYQVRFFSNKVEGFTTLRNLRVFYN